MYRAPDVTEHPGSYPTTAKIQCVSRWYTVGGGGYTGGGGGGGGGRGGYTGGYPPNTQAHIQLLMDTAV